MFEIRDPDHQYITPLEVALEEINHNLDDINRLLDSIEESNRKLEANIQRLKRS